MLGIFAAPITNAILLYCGYLSFKAIESDKGNDDTRTCTYIEMKWRPRNHISPAATRPLLPPASDGTSAPFD